MAQYKTGTITVTNGSQVVTGFGTLWLANVSPGDGFTVAGTGVSYEVGSVESDTQITLNANYAGSSGSGLSYAIWRDFTAPDNIPEMAQGDIETAAIFTRAIRQIQQRFNDPSEISALSAAGIYLTVSAGLADTLSGDFFFVIENNQYTLYRNNAGAAVEEFVFTGQAELLATLNVIYGLRDETQGYRDETQTLRSETDTLHKDFFGVYFGALATDPAADQFGSAPDNGDFYFNTSNNEVRFYFNGAWGSYGVLVTGAIKADETEARAGVDDAKYMTPLKTAQAIDQSKIRERLLAEATLNLDYANNKYEVYEGPVSGLTAKTFSQIHTFTRASGANARNAIGGLTPVLADQQRLVGNREGLLIEGQRTNLLLWSEDPSQWPQSTMAFDETTTDLVAGNINVGVFRETQDADNHRLGRIFGTAGDNVSTAVSIFIKDFGVRYVAFSSEANDGRQTSVVDLQTGDILTNNDAGYSVKATLLKPGEVLIQAIFSSSAFNVRRPTIRSASSYDGSSSWTADATVPGDSSRGFFAAGIQREDDVSFPTSYIKTEGSQVTRSADNAKRIMSTEWNPQEGTFIWEGIFMPNFNPIFLGATLNSSNGLTLGVRGTTANQFYFEIRKSGVGPTSATNRLTISDSLGIDPIKVKVAGTYRAGESGYNAISINGLVSEVITEIPTIAVGDNLLDVLIRGSVVNVRYVPKVSTAEELAILTAPEAN